MREVTAFVIDSALSQAAQWRQAGMRVQVSLNVSGRDLLDSGLADLVAAGPRTAQAARRIRCCWRSTSEC